MPWVLAAALGAVALGIGVTVDVQLSFLAALALVGLGALTAPAGVWVLCALVAAMTFRGLVELDLMPAAATFVDLPLAWGALAVALLKRRPRTAVGSTQLYWLLGLASAVALAWAFHPSEVLRPVLYLALLGEPFAIIGALLADPPSRELARALKLTLLTLVLVQIPIAAVQLVTLGAADNIQGTLYGAGAGAHVISAVLIVGGVWIASGGIGREVLGPARIPVIAILFVIPFIADAKQVVIALPALILASRWQQGPLQFAVRGVLVTAAVVALFTIAPAGDATREFIEKNERGEGGKQAAVAFIWDNLATDTPSTVFGKGPAETISRAAFMTTNLFQGSESPLAALDLKPAAYAAEAAATALEASGGGTSLNSGTSSALGVLGDLGLFGLLVYLGLLLSTFLRLRALTSPEGVAAATGFVLFLVLGLIDAWWEQPPIGVLIGVLAGLALSNPDERASSRGPRSDDEIPAGT